MLEDVQPEQSPLEVESEKEADNHDSAIPYTSYSVPADPKVTRPSRAPYVVVCVLLAALLVMSGAVAQKLFSSPTTVMVVDQAAIQSAVQATVQSLPNAAPTFTALALAVQVPPTVAPTSVSAANTPVSLTADESAYIKQLTVYKEGYQGLMIYFVLADNNSLMVAGEGDADLEISEGSGNTAKILYDKHLPITKDCFSKTSVGTGAFARDLLLCSFGRIAYSDFSGGLPTRNIGYVSLTFTTKSGVRLTSQEVTSLDLAPTPVPVAANTATPVVFPPGTQQAVATAQGTSTSLFDVPQPVSYTEFGYLNFIGVLTYNGDTLKDSPSIIINLTDDQGNLLASKKAAITPNYIRPRSQVPYLILISDPPAKWAKASIEVTADDIADYLRDYYYTDVTLEGITSKVTSSGVKSIGRVKNTGTKTLTSAKIIAAFYNDKDQLVDVVSTYMIQDSVAAGATGTFELDSSRTKSTKRIEFVVTGRSN